MKAITTAAMIAVVALAGVAGCGPSRAERANAEVARLAAEARSHLKSGDLDAAENAIDAVLTVEGATKANSYADLATQIRSARRRTDTDAFNRRAAELLRQAAVMAEANRAHESLVLVSKSLPQTSPAQQESAQALWARVLAATSDETASRYWTGFDLAALTDFREKGRLPDDAASTVADGPPHGDALRRLWLATLRRTLPVALADAEIRADEAADPDHSLPAPTIEQVAADPTSWVRRQVQFDRVWLAGEMLSTMRYGRLLTVTSPAGKKYEPYTRDGALVFATYRDVARQLESVLGPGKRSQARLFCKIVRGSETGPVRATSFYLAMVYKVELYSE